MTDNKQEPVHRFPDKTWQDRVVTPDDAMTRIESGMCIFIGTGAAEPRSLVNSLVDSEASGFKDLELIQLISFGDVISSKYLRAKKYRLKTFFSGGNYC